MQIKLFITILVTSFLGMMALQASAQKEIDALLEYVGKLEGAVFIRNGKEHTAKESQAHMKLKWSRQKKKVRTAEDFINLCASKSYISGKRYVIKMKDGAEKYCDEVLKAELKRIRTSNK